MEKNNKVANAYNKELIRCIKEEDGKIVVKYLSPYVVKSAYLFERTGFKPDDPNLDEKLGGTDKEVLHPIENTNTTMEFPTDIDFIGHTDEKPQAEIKESPVASSLIQRFTDSDGTPRKKRKRLNIKIHHGD